MMEEARVPPIMTTVTEAGTETDTAETGTGINGSRPQTVAAAVAAVTETVTILAPTPTQASVALAANPLEERNFGPEVVVANGEVDHHQQHQNVDSHGRQWPRSLRLSRTGAKPSRAGNRGSTCTSP